ncbi:MAG TPA: Plug domain-containing protein [Bacteroidales bacterium]|nr:Plug domain-containing protein [Bacteroidales bacterium]
MKQVWWFIRLFNVLIIITGFSGLLSGQSQYSDPIPRQLARFQGGLQPQKLFIHFDKEHYVAGETIWLKGYLVEATEHLPHSSSANVYLELWNVRGEKVRELIFQPSYGHFYGYIDIDPDIPDGNYVIRAYTDHMLNLGESFLFHKYFYISNPNFANAIDDDTRKFNRDFNQALEAMNQNIMVQFFPEGGNIIAGLESVVAVKVTDQAGNGYKVTGAIKDGAGKTLIEFETNHAGIGMFSLKPLPETQYIAHFDDGHQKLISKPLPYVYEHGFALKADIENGLLKVTVSHSPETLQPLPSSLIAQTRGETVFYKPDIYLGPPQEIQIPLSNFPTGITHLTLFSNDLKPVAERLLFVNHDDQIYFDINARILRSGDAHVLNIEVLATDLEGNPIEGNFSVAVQYGGVGERTHHENIFTYLLMNSELKGLVTDPVKYFDHREDQTGNMLDYLLLTHTWQRFSWEEVFIPSGRELTFFPSYGANISGRLTTGGQVQTGVGNVEVQMRLVENPSVTSTTITNAEGNFSFRDVSIAEGALVEIIPPMLAGRQIPEITLNTTARSDQGVGPVIFVPNVYTLPKKITERGSSWRRPRAERSERETPMSVQLFGAPDQTIYINPDEHYTRVIDILRDKAKGLTVSPSGFIMIRGASSIMHQSQPLFFVDGIESQAAFLGTHPRDIERIEIFRSASAAVFGARGAAGALVAYTRKHTFESEQTAQNIFSVSGIHEPRKFFQETEKPIVFNEIYPVKTAFWEPMLVTDKNGKASFRFSTLPGVTQYRIVIQGVGNNGKVGFAEFVIGN